MTSLPQDIEAVLLDAREQYLAAGWDTELFEMYWEGLTPRQQYAFLLQYDPPAGTRAAARAYRACLKADLLVRKAILEGLVAQQEDLAKQIDALRQKSNALVTVGNRLVETAHLEAP